MATRWTSLAFQLFTWWQTVPPGIGVSMDQMLVAMDVADPQSIRQVLTQIRKGRVPDPSMAGAYLRPLPVRHNAADGLYYDLSSVSGDAVAATIPGTILENQFRELFTRVFTLDNSMGTDGLVRSAHELLDYGDIRRLIAQLPLARVWQVQDLVGQIARARQLLEIEVHRAALIEAGAIGPDLSAPTKEDQ